MYMYASVAKYKDQPYRLTLNKRDAEALKLEHGQIVKVTIELDEGHRR